MNKLKVLLKKIGRTPEVVEIDDTLEAKQKLVGGLIEVVPYDDFDIVCNEEGKLLGLYPNAIFDYDMINGNFFIVGEDYDKGEFKSLTDEDIEQLTTDLHYRSVSYSPSQMKAVFKQEKELDERFEEEHKEITQEEYEKLMKLYKDMEKDLEIEYSDDDLNEMEAKYMAENPTIKIEDLSKNVVIDFIPQSELLDTKSQEAKEFIEQSKEDYDFEEREEI